MQWRWAVTSDRATKAAPGDEHSDRSGDQPPAGVRLGAGLAGVVRSGRDLVGALQALSNSQPRYVRVAERAGVDFPDHEVEFEIISSSEGGGGTAFGVPSVITGRDRLPVTAAEAERLGSLVAVSWEVFEEIAQIAPEELTKGPRGGGRDTSRIIEHVIEADRAYAREIGIKYPTVDPHDREAVARLRAAMLDVLCMPSNGSPLADRKWPLRYAARRIAWHSLDHAWEIETVRPAASGSNGPRCWQRSWRHSRKCQGAT